jgi:hypothetical protein
MVPFMQYLLSYHPQPVEYMLLAFGYGMVTMVIVEIGKWLVFSSR